MNESDSQLDHKYLSVAPYVPEKGGKMINKTNAVPALGRFQSSVKDQIEINYLCSR